MSDSDPKSKVIKELIGCFSQYGFYNSKNLYRRLWFLECLQEIFEGVDYNNFGKEIFSKLAVLTLKQIEKEYDLYKQDRLEEEKRVLLSRNPASQEWLKTLYFVMEELLLFLEGKL